MQIDALITRLMDRVVAFLPNAVGGLLLVALGLFAGWFVKRVAIQTLTILRLHRYLVRFRWGRSLSRVDVRLSLYGLIGNLFGIVVFLIFLNAALTAMGLTVVSGLISRAVLLFPQALISLSIFGIGWVIASLTTNGIRRALLREKIPHATLIASYVRGLMLLFFAAMALAEIDVSRDIVVIGFGVAFATMGALTIVLALRITSGGEGGAVATKNPGAERER